MLRKMPLEAVQQHSKVCSVVGILLTVLMVMDLVLLCWALTC